jgi:hypothetical protein
MAYGPWFTASYDSECDYCADDIFEGENIRSDGEGCWLCGTCGLDGD